jgi:hypothetical protein
MTGRDSRLTSLQRPGKFTETSRTGRTISRPPGTFLHPSDEKSKTRTGDFHRQDAENAKVRERRREIRRGKME